VQKKAGHVAARELVLISKKKQTQMEGEETIMQNTFNISLSSSYSRVKNDRPAIHLFDCFSVYAHIHPNATDRQRESMGAKNKLLALSRQYSLSP
jgi:hypothetical protein